MVIYVLLNIVEGIIVREREREDRIDQTAGGSTAQNEFRVLGGTRDHVWGRGSTGNQKLSEEWWGGGETSHGVRGVD